MSFKKRNVVLGAPVTEQTERRDKTPPVGTRPSPLDGRLTTSTGTSSLDSLLSGHAGLPLGSSILIGEAGTTDFAGVLLRYVAAEGLVQGHHVHLLGYGPAWRRELPGLTAGGSSKAASKDQGPAGDRKMKIAWRYESLESSSSSGTGLPISSPAGNTDVNLFCHGFDLAKKLDQSVAHGTLHATPASPAMSPPFKQFLASVQQSLRVTDPTVVHRIVIPGLLSPTLYNHGASQPRELLQFLHGLRALLRRYANRVTAAISFPTSLYPRSCGLIRWAEILSDGVFELIPFEHRSQMEEDPLQKTEKVQGLLRIHSLPVFHEKGGGLEGSWEREDHSFKLTSTNGLVITRYSLPPVDDEQQSSAKDSNSTTKDKDSLDF